jgi:hypothetical protein
MIDYAKQARDIFDMVVSMPVVSTDETVRHVEERIRKLGYTEKLIGYFECQREEKERHTKLRAQLDEARNRFNMPQVG